MGPVRNRARRALAILLLVIIAADANRTGHAGDAGMSDQWNIMVVPARQTVYSSLARERFEKNCASCHSKDGRAQTPVARQRHVRDLSESKLADEAIIEQVLRGTHVKIVDFRMPPFNEKLSRAEIESLIPVVKAFRPVSSEEENSVEANPRLAGIMDFPNRNRAFLEKVARCSCSRQSPPKVPAFSSGRRLSSA
jgi:mono/diheme cytochrome c family protein